MAEWKENDTTVISMAYGRTEDEATDDAVKYILGFLLEHCFTILVSVKKNIVKPYKCKGRFKETTLLPINL